MSRCNRGAARCTLEGARLAMEGGYPGEYIRELHAKVTDRPALCSRSCGLVHVIKSEPLLVIHLRHVAIISLARDISLT